MTSVTSPWSVLRSCIFSWRSRPPLHAWVGSWNTRERDQTRERAHAWFCMFLWCSSHRKRSPAPVPDAGTSSSCCWRWRRTTGPYSPTTTPAGTEPSSDWTSQPRRHPPDPGSAWTRLLRSSESAHTHTHTHTHREREKDTQRERKTQRERDTHTQRHAHTERERERDTQRERETHTHRERERHTHTHTQRHAHTERERDTQRERETHTDLIDFLNKSVPVAQWLEHCVSSAKGCGFDSQGTHILTIHVTL